MKKSGNIIWGVVLIAVGIIFALNALEITNIDVFFDGWWTLFIIVPCAIGIIQKKDIIENIIGIVIGVFLLLCSRDILDFSMLWKLCVPAIIILIGCKLIFGNLFERKSDKVSEKISSEGKEIKKCCATFSSANLVVSGETFSSAELDAVFGGVVCDIKNAVIEEDCVIKASAIFGGIDIMLPENVNVKINSNSIFGGISNKNKNQFNKELPTLYINGTCMFGGIELK